ncbi:TetR/AcrR family transcriptional regulator [Timonella senegalensis]|uniref:TetR/AcrR family transcriptional regulator n=1 Tax=Timonella senegalensis TaxID=1465825 RepID=UPI002FDEADC1
MAERRIDPERRERILAVTRELIATNGVDGVTHRKVAAAADVPLGAMTYYFSGRDELLFEVFTRFADEVAARFATRMSAATNYLEARDAVVSIITHDVFPDRERADARAERARSNDLVITHELYALAARRPEYREITHTWMAKSRAALEQHFDPDTARMLDALIEGLTIHRALDTEDVADLAVEAVLRITN